MFDMPDWLRKHWMRLPLWARVIIGIPVAPLWMMGSVIVVVGLFLMAIVMLLVEPMANLITGRKQ